MRKRSRKVVPYIGTWIETNVVTETNESLAVVPYIGTWIETSKPPPAKLGSTGRTLYRYVD